jgi:hypothetical protein
MRQACQELMPPRPGQTRQPTRVPLARHCVTRVAASRPEARDEGSRLIPLDNQPEDIGFGKLNYYLRLADKMLQDNTPARKVKTIAAGAK